MFLINSRSEAGPRGNIAIAPVRYQDFRGPARINASAG